jgi:transcriptional regulator with XRE-family HTH domain
MENPTVRLIDLIRRAHGGCSDYRIAKILGVEDSAVSRWMNGRGQMSDSLITRACIEAKVEDPLRWRAFIGAVRERGPEGDHWREKRDDFLLMESGFPPREGGELQLFIKGLKGKVASILLAGVVLVGLEKPISAEACAPATEGGAPVCILWQIGRRKLFRWLKNKNALPLPESWTWARIRSMGSVLRSLSLSPVPI